MSNTLIEQLDQLYQEASTALADATSMAASEAWYREYLSRQGRLTGLLKGLGQLAAEERPATGQKANQVQNGLEAILKERQDTIRQLEMEQALAAEGIDVSMPGRRPQIG